MWFLLLQIFLLLLVAAALGGAIAYWWLKSRFEDVTEAHADLLAQVRRLEKQGDPVTREDVAASAAGVTATSCLTHRGENDRTAPGKPALTALTGDTATPRPAAASCGAAVVTEVLITGSGRTPALLSD